MIAQIVVEIPMYDKKTGKPAGTAKIPLEILEAAHKVSAWMQKQNGTTQLCGLRLIK